MRRETRTIPVRESGLSAAARHHRCHRRKSHLVLGAEVEPVLPDQVLSLPAGRPGERGVQHGTELIARHRVWLQFAVGDTRAQRAGQVVVLQLQQVLLTISRRRRHAGVFGLAGQGVVRQGPAVC